MMRLAVKDIISSTVAISQTSGIRLYEEVKEKVVSRTPVVVSFDGIENLSSAFCNAFLGKLYMEFGEEQLNNLIQIVGTESNEVWAERIRMAKVLGVNEKFRKADQENLSELFN